MRACGVLYLAFHTDGGPHSTHEQFEPSGLWLGLRINGEGHAGGGLMVIGAKGLPLGGLKGRGGNCSPPVTKLMYCP